jgi:UDP-N-acetylglucosamine transferase subunit ALG13
MIFVAVGSQKFQFNRLLKAIDELIESKTINDEVYAQTGYCDYKPKFYSFNKFIDKDEFSRIIEESKLVVSHAGAGIIISAVRNDKPIIVVPRLSKFNEHVDDHQREIADEFEKAGIIMVVREISDMGTCYLSIDEFKRKKFKSGGANLINDIRAFIEGEF